MEENKNNINELKEIKNYLMDYLQQQGYYNPDRQGRILCKNPEHQEKRPSMSYNKKNNTLHCFSCNATYSIIDLAIIDQEIGDQAEPLEARLKNKENIGLAIKHIKDLFNISGELPKHKAYTPIEKPKASYNLNEIFKKGVYGAPTREYLSSRGITNEKLIQALKITNNYINDLGVINIPYELEPDIKTITQRTISKGTLKDIKDLPKEDRYKHLGETALYDPFKYLLNNAPRIVFITEGELDAISIYQALGELKEENIKLEHKIGSIALGGIANIKKVIQAMQQIETNNLYLIMALDNDKRGIQASRDLEMALRDLENSKGLNIKFCNALDLGIFKSDKENISYKDINDLLKDNKEALKSFIKDIDKNINDYIEKAKTGYYEAIAREKEKEKEIYINENSLINYLDLFLDHIEHPKKTIQSYFNNLDKILKGGFREGLITLGAVSSLGKTSFILQLADQIAQSRQQDILYYSLEMAKDELIAKSLSRIMYLKCETKTQNVKNHSEILSKAIYKPEEKELFKKALETYKSYAKNIYIIEGVNNLGVEEIRKQALEHKEKTGKAPFILIDYLQILASPKDSRGLSDKQKTDENILQLKQLSRDLKTTILIVSSLNRASYNLNVSLESFKESGAIEYTSDIILGLNYNLTEKELDELKEIRKSLVNLPEDEKLKKINDFYKDIRARIPRNIRLDILKNRQGEYNKSIDLLFYPQFNYFKEELASLDTHKALLEHSLEHALDNEEYIELPF